MRLACCLVAAATAALPPSPAAPPPDAELELAELRKHAPRPRCTHWNESTALKHELAFEQCVAPTAEKNMRDQLLVNGSAPLSGIAQLLLFTYPEEVCKCTLKLENAVTCSKYSSAHAILQVYQPWCWMLAECGHMAQALLRAAYLCNTAGMSGNDTTALCKDDGANGCALATENLFGATHAETWVNDTELLQTLHVPISYAIGRRLEAPKQPAAAFAADGGDKREDDFFGQLSYCMQRVHVVEEQLHLAMSLSVLSGNGSFDEYEDLFKDKCQRTFAYAWLVDSIYDYTGASYAYDEWNENTWTGEAIAITIAVANLVALACCCAALYTCVKRGYCYRICSPSSKEERAGLRDTDIKPPAEGGRAVDDEIIE